MNRFEYTYQHITPHLDSWPELKLILETHSKKQPFGWDLPVIIGQANGASEERLYPAMSSIACLQTSIVIIDDILDEDTKGVHIEYGVAKASNFAFVLQSLGSTFLTSAPFASDVCTQLLHVYHTGAIETALGQHWDVAGIESEADYWRIAQQKSGEFFKMLFLLGAISGGVNEAEHEAIGRLGALFGELVQINDDLKDTFSTPADIDWILGRKPLPILYGQQVNHPQQQHFIALCDQISKLPPADSTELLEEAHQIMVQCGALSYGVHHLLDRDARAMALLEQISFKSPEMVRKIFERTIKPTHTLLARFNLKPSDVI